MQVALARFLLEVIPVSATRNLKNSKSYKVFNSCLYISTKLESKSDSLRAGGRGTRNKVDDAFLIKRI